MTKDLQESNHIVRWGVSVGTLAFFLLLIFIVTIDFEFLRDPAITKDYHLRTFLFCIALFFTAVICRRFIHFLATYLNHAYLKRFSEIKMIGTFKESRGKQHSSLPKLPHAVLLLHGFLASPQEFKTLISTLDELQIPYFAPNIIGFGLNTLELLEKLRCEDWFRRALDYYDSLHCFAENISIVGHSMGAMLGTFIAQHRKVDHLILSGPGFFSVKRDLKYKRLLLFPLVSEIYSWVIPFLPKPIRKGRKTTADVLDYSATPDLFQYLAVPTKCIAQIFKMQDRVNILNAHFNTLTVIHGKYDHTVDNARFINLLETNHIKFDQYCLKNSAHCPLEDYDKKLTCDIIKAILTDEIPPQP